LETLSQRSRKLEHFKAEIGPLEASLNMLTNAEDGRMLAWTATDDGSPAPVADLATRSEIETKIAEARAQARSADSATASIASQIERVSATIRAISLRITQAAANIAVEEAEGLFPALTEAIALTDSLRGRVMAARVFMIRASDPPAGQVVGAITLPFERFDRGYELATGKPTSVLDVGEWFGLATALAGDAHATL
jgi:hypothetical protein